MSTKLPQFHRPIVRRVVGHIQSKLIAGALILLPVIITYFIFRFIFETVDPLLGDQIGRITGYTVRGLGIVGLVLLAYLVGLVGANFIGRRLIRVGQQSILQVPLIRTIYSPAKLLIESFSGTGATGFKRVVFIEYPRKGMWTIGFLTSITKDETGRSLAVVYIPTAPTPNSGWVAILPVEEVYDTDLSVPDAIKIVLSGGIVSPPQIKKRPVTL